jgi:phage terminase small subunit
MPYKRPDSEIPTKGKGSKLTAKQEAFVNEFLVDLNASAAVLRAGYNTRNQNRIAAELLRHPLIAKTIKERTEKKRETMVLQADYLINKLIQIIEDPDTKTGDILRAIELAGKSIALWKERHEVSGPDGEAIKIEQQIKEEMDEFTRKLSGLARRAGEGEVVEFPKPRSEG